MNANERESQKQTEEKAMKICEKKHDFEPRRITEAHGEKHNQEKIEKSKSYCKNQGIGNR